MMNGYLINKTQYDFFSKHMRANISQVTLSKSCEWMVNTHRLGRIIDRTWFYTDQDRVKIIDLIQDQLGVDLLTDGYPQKRDRMVNAQTQSNEKHNALAVSHDFVLVNAFKQLCLNQEQIELGLLNTLGTYINVNKVSSVEHCTIVFVENLAVMANLDKLVFTENAQHLQAALWVYRGDKKHEQTTGQAYAFFRQFIASHQLVCFADFDPAGLNIAITCGATQLLAPTLVAFDLIDIKGAEQAYYNQQDAKKCLDKRTDLSMQCQHLYRGMKAKKRTIQQEHLLSHQIPLSIYEIS